MRISFTNSLPFYWGICISPCFPSITPLTPRSAGVSRCQVRTLPPKETQTELHDINIKQLELERQGVELEKTIRQLTEQDDKQQKGNGERGGLVVPSRTSDCIKVMARGRGWLY